MSSAPRSGPEDLPIDSWLAALAAPDASDLYITVGAAPVLRGDNGFALLHDHALGPQDVRTVIGYFLNAPQLEAFQRDREFNMAWAVPGVGRFRVNMFFQRQTPGLVLRKVSTSVPTLEQLRLPMLLGDLVMEKRGLVVVVGATGSGKSTTLAAMIAHRNAAAPGHIVTIEDPIEFLHQHNMCVVTQREMGIDTLSWESALKNALRQKPDVILIGEIRDRATMEHALNIAETGHLALATLHANNANQAIDRVLSFFPPDQHRQVLLGLSMNLRGIVSQRLVARYEHIGGRAAALEILLNQGLVRELVRKGEVKDLKKVMADNTQSGMQTFDQALLALVHAGHVAPDTAIAEADNPADLGLALRQMQAASDGGLASLDTSRLKL